MSKILAVDFDGVIHKYSNGWADGSIYDDPIEGAQDTLKTLSKIFKIVVYTARPDIHGIASWMLKHNIHFDEITHEKPIAYAYIDDNAIRFNSWDQAIQDLWKIQ